MPRLLQQVRHTTDARAQLLADPRDRFAGCQAPIEELGGRIEQGYFAFGDQDTVRITGVPDHISAAAIALALVGGALKSCNITLLLTNAEALDAMRNAANCGYQPIVKAASAAAR